MNSVTHQMNWEIEGLFAWYDDEPSLRCAVITGEGQKAFCAGSDLLEIETTQKALLDGRDAKMQNLGSFAPTGRFRWYLAEERQEAAVGCCKWAGFGRWV